MTLIAIMQGIANFFTGVFGAAVILTAVAIAFQKLALMGDRHALPHALGGGIGFYAASWIAACDCGSEGDAIAEAGGCGNSGESGCGGVEIAGVDCDDVGTSSGVGNARCGGNVVGIARISGGVSVCAYGKIGQRNEEGVASAGESNRSRLIGLVGQCDGAGGIGAPTDGRRKENDGSGSLAGGNGLRETGGAG